MFFSQIVYLWGLLLAKKRRRANRPAVRICPALDLDLITLNCLGSMRVYNIH